MELLISELKYGYIRKNPKGEGNYLFISDAETRKHGNRIGLGTRVVHAVNDEY